jgi:hypothetical protein
VAKLICLMLFNISEILILKIIHSKENGITDLMKETLIFLENGNWKKKIAKMKKKIIIE